MTRRLFVGLGATVMAAALLAAGAQVQAQAQPAAQVAEPVKNLYAVEIRTGTAWDSAKPAHEQAHFRDHSANLKRLRDQGALVLGARYSDKGLVVLQAASEPEAHAMMQADASIQHRVFSYELHEFKVFYAGAVQPKRRGP